MNVSCPNFIDWRARNLVAREYPASNRDISVFVVSLLDNVSGRIRPTLLARAVGIGMLAGIIALCPLSSAMRANVFGVSAGTRSDWPPRCWSSPLPPPGPRTCPPAAPHESIRLPR